MRLLIQRVSNGHVSCSDGHEANIEKGYVIFAGFTHTDNEQMIMPAVKKVLDLRIFEDEKGKMNRSITDEHGSIMLISQFTLYGSTDRGRRPSFDKSLNSENARCMFDKLKLAFEEHIETKSGVFGSYMSVKLVNEGPVTFMLEF